MRLVVDTNVIIAGLLRVDGPPSRIIDSILRQSYVVLYDDRILREYETALVRPRFGLDRDVVLSFTSFIRETGERIVAPSLDLRCLDRADQPFLEVAVEGLADALVTGNQRHFPAKSPVRIVTPADLVRA